MNTSRVREALVAVANYVEFAHGIAANVQPVSLITQTIKPVSLPQDPSISELKINTSKNELTVNGKNLKSVKFFQITFGGDTKYSGPVSKPNRDESLVITLNPQSSLNPGRYMVRLFVDQNHFDSKELVIDSSISTHQSGNASYEVVAVIPNEVVVGCQATSVVPKNAYLLVISAGDRFPDEIKFESENDFVECGKIILTGNPKNMIIPITFKTDKCQSAKGRQTREIVVRIKVLNSVGGGEGSFEFNLWLL